MHRSLGSATTPFEESAGPWRRFTGRRELRVNKRDSGLKIWVRQHTIEPSVQHMNKSSPC